MNKGIIIYGNGDFAGLMKYCIDNDDDREIKKKSSITFLLQKM